MAGVRQTSHAWYCFENVERFELVFDPVALLSACDTSCFKRIRTSSPAILSLTELSRFSAFLPLQVDRRKCCQLSSIDRSTISEFISECPISFTTRRMSRGASTQRDARSLCIRQPRLVFTYNIINICQRQPQIGSLIVSMAGCLAVTRDANIRLCMRPGHSIIFFVCP